MPRFPGENAPMMETTEQNHKIILARGVCAVESMQRGLQITEPWTDTLNVEILRTLDGTLGTGALILHRNKSTDAEITLQPVDERLPQQSVDERIPQEANHYGTHLSTVGEPIQGQRQEGVRRSAFSLVALVSALFSWMG